VYLGYHPGMPRANRPSLVLLLACVLPAACASKLPSPEPLCGTWSDGANMTERWWLDGKDLRGQGEVEGSTETLELVAGRRGHVYVARPNGVEPTEFAPIDPASARFGADAPAAAQVWVWANYEHDFPQEITYVLSDGNRLEAKIAGPSEAPGDHGGRSMGWTLERTAACGEEPKP
jgi:hypothetical protein